MFFSMDVSLFEHAVELDQYTPEIVFSSFGAFQTLLYACFSQAQLEPSFVNEDTVL